MTAANAATDADLLSKLLQDADDPPRAMTAANAGKGSASIGSHSPTLIDTGAGTGTGALHQFGPQPRASDSEQEPVRRLSLTPTQFCAVLESGFVANNNNDDDDHESQPTWKTSSEDAANTAEPPVPSIPSSKRLLPERASIGASPRAERGKSVELGKTAPKPPGQTHASQSQSQSQSQSPQLFSNAIMPTPPPFAPVLRTQPTNLPAADVNCGSSNTQVAILAALLQAPLLVFTLLLPAKLDGRFDNADYAVISIPLFLTIAAVGGVLANKVKESSTKWYALALVAMVLIFVVLGVIKVDEGDDAPHGWVLPLVLLASLLFPIWLWYARTQVYEALDETPINALPGHSQANTHVVKSPTTTRHLLAAHKKPHPGAVNDSGDVDPSGKRKGLSWTSCLKRLFEGQLFLLLELTVQLLTVILLVCFAGVLGHTLDRRDDNEDLDSNDYGQAFLVWHYATALQLLGIAWCCLIDHGMWPASWGSLCTCYDHHLDDRACFQTIASMVSAFIPLFSGSLFLLLLYWRFESDESKSNSHYIVFIPVYILQALGLCGLPMLALDPFRMEHTRQSPVV